MRTTERPSVRDSRERALSAMTASPFIGNVVASFVGLNRAGERDRLDDALTRFGGLFAYISETSGETGLRDELRFVERYLGIQKMRFSGRFEYSIRTDGNSTAVRRFSLFETVEPIVRLSLENGSGKVGILLECPAVPGGDPPSARLVMRHGSETAADVEWPLGPRRD